MEGFGKVHITKAPDFTLDDQNGDRVSLSEMLKVRPVVLAFYPGDFTPVCTKQLCNYRDNIAEFESIPATICGISGDTSGSHQSFSEEHKFPFRLLSDPGKKVAKLYGATSLIMLGGVSRAIFIINQKGMILYRYVEPTILTSRKADEVVAILQDLKAHKLI